MHCSTVTTKGQVTIPIEFRHMFDISSGDRISFSNINNTLVIKKAKTPTFEDLYNCLPKSNKLFTIEEMDETMGKALGEKYAKCLD